jgi:hypothetical protein
VGSQRFFEPGERRVVTLPPRTSVSRPSEQVPRGAIGRSGGIAGLDALQMQRSLGNRATIEHLKSKAKRHGHKEELEDNEDVKEKGKTSGPVVQRLFGSKKTAPVAYAPAPVNPNYVLTTPAPKRSNSSSSTLTPKTPKFKGATAFESGTKKWKYQVTSINSPATKQLVYYTKSHYPAPESDGGALSNVTESNWKGVVTDLQAGRIGIAGAWSAYDAEELHENYHYVNEWQAVSRPKFMEAQNEIAALEVDEATASSQSKANAMLEPEAKKIFKTKVTEARSEFFALGDSPGDPPYIAQAPAIDALVTRVQSYAATKAWT